MERFEVAFHSFEDVRDFVFLAAAQRFDITVSNGIHTVDAKSLMVMFSLDYSQPLKVCAIGAGEDLPAFVEAASRFRVS